MSNFEKEYEIEYRRRKVFEPISKWEIVVYTILLVAVIVMLWVS